MAVPWWLSRGSGLHGSWLGLGGRCRRCRGGLGGFYRPCRLDRGLRRRAGSLGILTLFCKASSEHSHDLELKWIGD